MRCTRGGDKARRAAKRERAERVPVGSPCDPDHAVMPIRGVRQTFYTLNGGRWNDAGGSWDEHRVHSWDHLIGAPDRPAPRAQQGRQGEVGVIPPPGSRREQPPRHSTEFMTDCWWSGFDETWGYYFLPSVLDTIPGTSVSYVRVTLGRSKYLSGGKPSSIFVECSACGQDSFSEGVCHACMHGKWDGPTAAKDEIHERRRALAKLAALRGGRPT